jgi:outer membrane biosynthesis protein TonB
MSEPMPEVSGGNILTRKYAGIPGYVWLAGAALIVYLVLRSRSSSASGNSAGSSAPPAPSDSTTTVGAPVTFPSNPLTVNITNPQQPKPVTTPKPKPKPPPKEVEDTAKPPVKKKTVTTSKKVTEPED